MLRPLLGKIRRHTAAPVVAATAVKMSLVAASGCDTIDACEASTSWMVEPPRSAMNRCAAGGMARS